MELILCVWSLHGKFRLIYILFNWKFILWRYFLLASQIQREFTEGGNNLGYLSVLILV